MEAVPMQDRVFNLLVHEDDITWQSMIHELVKTEQMDPWDISISGISSKFLEMLKTMKEMDLRVSGKVILAAAILLRLQSTKLLDEDLAELDRLLAATDDVEDQFYEELDELSEGNLISPIDRSEIPKLKPRTPQPRKRKVSVYDLVGALQKALEVKARRPPRVNTAPDVEPPKRKFDINQALGGLYRQIVQYFDDKDQLWFSQLIPSDTKEDKVFTFIPLLHLTNQRRVDLDQEEHFSDFKVMLLKQNELVEKELS